MSRSKLFGRLAPLGCGLALTAFAAEANADVTIWEQPGAMGPERYLRFTGFAQPSFLWRQNDDCQGDVPESECNFNPNEDDTFVVSRARIGFDMKLWEYVYAELETELTPNASLLDAYVDIRPFDWLQVRFGQHTIPFLTTYRFGAQNLAFNDRAMFTPLGGDRSYLRYLNQRDIGLQFRGRVGDLDHDSMIPVFEYGLGAYLGRGVNQTTNDDQAFLYSGRVLLHALGLPEGFDWESDLARNHIPRVTLGAAVYSNCDDRGQWNRGWTTDAEFRYEGLYASAAFVWFKNGASAGLGDALGYDATCGDGVAGVGDHIAYGASTQVQYVLPEQWLGDQHALELLTRFDTVSPNDACDINTDECRFLGGDDTTPGYIAPPSYDDSDNAPTRVRLTFGLNYFPTSEQNLRLSVNYQHRRETEEVQTAEGFKQGILDDIFWVQLTAGL